MSNEDLLYMRKTSFSAGGLTAELPLTIKFRVPFGDESEVDTVDVEVFNLKDETINRAVIDTKATLIAGYKADNGVIFEGTLKKIASKWDNVDKIVTFKCIDSTTEYAKEVAKKTYDRNTKASIILKDLAKKAELKIGDIDLEVDFIYRSGKTVNGKIQKVLTEIGKDCKSRLFVNKGQIYARKTTKHTDMALLISKETGLIDEPEVIEEQQTDEKGSKLKNDKKVVKGYKVRSLLNHKITTDVTVSLQSKKVTGVFYVTKGEHISDGDGQYYTEFEVAPV